MFCYGILVKEINVSFLLKKVIKYRYLFTFFCFQFSSNIAVEDLNELQVASSQEHTIQQLKLPTKKITKKFVRNVVFLVI